MAPGYAARVGKDIQRWREADLIDAATADALSRDIQAQTRSRPSFGSILATFAALLFAAGLLIFVASDWDGIPRLARAGGIAILVLAFNLAGAFLKSAGKTGFAEASWLGGAASWGAGVILVGRMYGLPADEGFALLLWCLGTALAAAAFPSASLTVAAAALALAWLLFHEFKWTEARAFPLAYPLLAAAVWAVSLRSNSRRARELLLLSLLPYFFFLAQRFGPLSIGAALAAFSGLLFALASRQPRQAEWLLRVDGRAPLYLLLLSILGFAIAQGEVIDRVGFAVSAAVILVAIAAALLVGGRASAGVRRVCYVAFAAEICVVFGVTVGSALDTVSFFLLAALFTAVLAFAVFRLERRWQAPDRGLGGA